MKKVFSVKFNCATVIIVLGWARYYLKHDKIWGYLKKNTLFKEILKFTAKLKLIPKLEKSHNYQFLRLKTSPKNKDSFTNLCVRDQYNSPVC